MLGLVGVTAMETSFAGVTVNVVDPDILPDVPVIVVEPAVAEVASPAPLMAATDVADELQVTDCVRSCVVLSENVPVAVNCSFVPEATLGLAGVIAKETSVAGVTHTVVHPDLFPNLPQIFAQPECVAVMYPGSYGLELEANPVNFASSMPDEISEADEVQVTDDVRSCVVLSE
jgi:hypothetical protein